MVKYIISVPIIITVYGHTVCAGNIATANHKHNMLWCVITINGHQSTELVYMSALPSCQHNLQRPPYTRQKQQGMGIVEVHCIVIKH